MATARNRSKDDDGIKSEAESFRTEDGLTVVTEGDTTPVYMRHPDVADTAGPVTAWSFESYYKLKGWVLVPDPTPDEDNAPAPSEGGADSTEDVPAGGDEKDGDPTDPPE